MIGSTQGIMWKLLGLLAAGAAAGVVMSWLLSRALRAKVKIYEAYLHERIGGRFNETLAGAKARPELIIRGTAEGQPVAYQCSGCGQEFYLPGDSPPQEAVARMFAQFAAHLEREHPKDRPAEPLRRSGGAA